MKIVHTDGSVTDTDQLNDLSAEILEHTKAYTDFMCSRKVPFLLRFYDPVRNTCAGAGNSNDSLEDTSKILFAIDMFTRPLGYALVKVEETQ